MGDASAKVPSRKMDAIDLVVAGMIVATAIWKGIGYAVGFWLIPVLIYTAVRYFIRKHKAKSSTGS